MARDHAPTGLVLVSHSAMLLDGLCAMAAQVAGEEVLLEAAGGTDDGRLGTSAAKIGSALRRVLDGADDALVLLDLGSAVLSLELALQALEPADRARVRVSAAPLVEGTIVAAVQASLGASIEAVAAAAAQAMTLPKDVSPDP